MVIYLKDNNIVIFEPAELINISTSTHTLTIHLESMVSISTFKKEFVDFPYIDPELIAFSYEPDNSLYIVEYSHEKNIRVFTNPNQSFILNWIHTNIDKIRTQGINWRKNEMKGINE